MITLDLKCELRDPDLARIIARHARALLVAECDQHDQYYRLPDAHLFRRSSGETEPIEWIHAVRERRARPTMSHFQIYDERRALEKWGRLMRPWVAVKKHRAIYMLDTATIRLDRVEEAGSYFEASTLVTPAQHLARCYDIIARIRAQFAMALGEAVAGSYADMIAAKADTKAPRPDPPQ
ncbi:MAG: hypothetical protein ACTS3F_07615 [Phycisphaerales bacterium]